MPPCRRPAACPLHCCVVTRHQPALYHSNATQSPSAAILRTTITLSYTGHKLAAAVWSCFLKHTTILKASSWLSDTRRSRSPYTPTTCR